MPASHHSVFTGWMPFLPPNQQRQSTEALNDAKSQLNTVHKTKKNKQLSKKKAQN